MRSKSQINYKVSKSTHKPIKFIDNFYRLKYFFDTNTDVCRSQCKKSLLLQKEAFINTEDEIQARQSAY